MVWGHVQLAVALQHHRPSSLSHIIPFHVGKDGI